MRNALGLFVLVVSLVAGKGSVLAEDMLTDRFEDLPETRWMLVSDGVMGGVSAGIVEFVEEDGRSHARLTGEVSTANNGGFLQIRRELSEGAPEDATGVRIVVRGNDQRYFVHLRTSGTLLPWQYYQSGFSANQDWTEALLPFTSFRRSGSLLREVPRADSLTSIAIVAFGRDHTVEVEVKEVSFY